MADPNLLICVGATKAGTSWLYSYLHDDEECHVRAVKECRYFLTLHTRNLIPQLMALSALIRDYDAQLVESEAADNVSKMLVFGRKVYNMAVLSWDRTADRAYLNYQHPDRTDETALQDVTPHYSLLDTPQIERVAQQLLPVKIFYLMRDPLERLWSHVRTHAQLTPSVGKYFVALYQSFLARILFSNFEVHIVKLGDYQANIERFDAVFDRTDFHIEFTENLTDEPRSSAMCLFFGITATSSAKVKPAHVGLPAPFQEVLRGDTLQFLKPQYDFVAKHFRIFPEAGQKKLGDFGVIKQDSNGYFCCQEGGA